MTAEDANYGLGRLIDFARAERVAVAGHGRPGVAVMAAEKFEQFMAMDGRGSAPADKWKART